MSTCKCGKEMFLIYENELNQRKWMCPHCLVEATCNSTEVIVWNSIDKERVVDNVSKSKSNKRK